MMWYWPPDSGSDIGGAGLEILFFVCAVIFGGLVFVTAMHFVLLVQIAAFVVSMIGAVVIRVSTDTDFLPTLWGVLCAIGTVAASVGYVLLTVEFMHVQDALCCLGVTLVAACAIGRLAAKIAR